MSSEPPSEVPLINPHDRQGKARNDHDVTYVYEDVGHCPPPCQSLEDLLDERTVPSGVQLDDERCRVELIRLEQCLRTLGEAT